MKILVIDDERPALNLLIETVKNVVGPNDIIIPFRSTIDFEDYSDEEKHDFDVAFVDIEIGAYSGIEFAEEIKKYSPSCNIIFVTSYEKYGAEAFNVRPSGYVLKPYTEEDIENELKNLRYPLEEPDNMNKIKVNTFGNFVVYNDEGNVFNFSRTAAKELFAYLIDCAGYPITTTDIAEKLYGKELDKQLSKNLSKVIKSMMDDLENEGYSDVVVKQNRLLQINKNRVNCDLYDVLSGDEEAFDKYYGEYMIGYSWASESESLMRLKEIVGVE
ncbi:MAG: response regulator [Lachnospiraceae bacterium]|nr:response regulator [Lachnospiraceae bacterium]